MAFWGIEVKPGKPYTHSFYRVRGRLRISQATLAIGSSTKKSLVQCNVGDKSPVLLCALLPDKTESLQLDLEFEESDDVVFSVIGPRGVYLTGYYVDFGGKSNVQDDTESYGEDIANTETEESNRCSNDDDYEDSFINDGEPEVLTPSVSSGRVDEEVVPAKKQENEKSGRKRLRKKYKLVDSDDETSSRHQNFENGSRIVPASDGEDNIPISSVYKNKATGKESIADPADPGTGAVATSHTTKELDVANAKTGASGSHVVHVNEKHDVQLIDEKIRKGDATCNILLPSDDGTKSKKKRKDVSEVLNGNLVDTVNGNNDRKVEASSFGQNVNANNGEDVQAVNDKTPGFLKISSLASEKVAADNGVKLKKKKKYPKKGSSVDVNSINDINTLKTDRNQQAVAVVDDVDKDMVLRDKDASGTSANREVNHSQESLLPTMEMGPERNSKAKKKRKEREEVGPDSNSKDMSLRTKRDQELGIHQALNINSDQLADGNQSEEGKSKKRSRKKSKEIKEAMNMEVKGENNQLIAGEKHVESRSDELRILSNGLIVEGIQRGNSNGKTAALGRKVKVHYIVKLKESGRVIDSNVGKSPHKFRLGDGDVNEGLNTGLEGMQVGDKRRLIIPPSLCSGMHGTGENIPPDSWLVYDVELVSVR